MIDINVINVSFVVCLNTCSKIIFSESIQKKRRWGQYFISLKKNVENNIKLGWWFFTRVVLKGPYLLLKLFYETFISPLCKTWFFRFQCEHCCYATVEKAALDKHRKFKSNIVDKTHFCFVLIWLCKLQIVLLFLLCIFIFFYCFLLNNTWEPFSHAELWTCSIFAINWFSPSIE